VERGASASILLAMLLAGCASPSPVSCPVKLDACYATSDGWAIQAAISGNATTATRGWALLVHGLNEDHHSYDALGRDLVAAGWRVVAIDSRGHGASVLRTDGSTRTLQQFASTDFVPMENDIDATESGVGNAPSIAIGASVGANEVLRDATRLDPRVPVVLLSPGLDYRGLQTSAANAAHQGHALFLASEEDTYAASSARSLAAQHASPHDVRIWSGKGHGTNLLDNETRAFILGWAKNATMPRP
jgi:alpha-beta hydrolase superfamily lysophospholipase